MTGNDDGHEVLKAAHNEACWEGMGTEVLGNTSMNLNPALFRGKPTSAHCCDVFDQHGLPEDFSHSKPAKPSPTAEDFALYPEGGLRAYSVVFGSFSGMLAGFGLMNTIGSFQAYLSQNQLAQYSESTIGWIFSLYVFLAFFCGVQIGPVFDAKGPRLLVLAGSVLLVGGLMLLSVSTKYWQFLLTFSIMGGTGTSLIFTPAISSVGHYFFRHRGAATGLAATGGSVGGIVFPLLLQYLFPRFGFGWSTRIMGFMLLFFVIIANGLIRSRLTPKKGGAVWPNFLIFRDPVFSLTTAGVFFVEWGLFIPLSYITSYALHYGLSNKFSYQLLAVVNVGSCFGRALPGFAADRLGRFNTMIMTVTLCVISCLAVWLPAAEVLRGPSSLNIAILCLFGVLFGFASGSNISLTPVCVGQLCDTEVYGTYYATCYTLVSFGCLTGIPIAGQIIAIDGGEFWGLILFTGTCYLGGLICFVTAKVMKVGWKLTRIY